MTEPQRTTTESSASSELTGGAGFTYEDSVVGYCLSALLRASPATSGHGAVIRVAVQQRAAGQPLDDIVVDTRDASGERRLSLQVKRSLTISAAESNRDFRKIVSDCRATRRDPKFRSGRDSYGFVAQYVAQRSARNLHRILELASASSNTAEFIQRFEGTGGTSQGLRKLRSELRELVAESDESEWDFYRHLLVPNLSGLEADGALRANIESNLEAMLADSQTRSGQGLFAALCHEARVGAGAGKTWTRATLLHDLRGSYRFRGIPAFADDFDTIRRMTENALSEISDKIGGYHVDRPTLVEGAFTLLETHRLVNVRGLPGCGKSAVLRNCAERLDGGPVLVLKSDRLSGRDWQGFAVAKGLTNRDPVELLAEIGSTGNEILFVDGIDRIPPDQQAIVNDLMRTIVNEPALKRWRVLVTSRNQGMEPFRVWVPRSLYAENGIGEVAVNEFDDDEAQRLAEQAPVLHPLLLGAEEVRSIVRRPFFAAVLARRDGHASEAASPQSEADLIRYWWRGGGYDAPRETVLLRQQALLDLAEAGGSSLGKSVSTRSLKPGTVERLTELSDDGVVRTQDDNATFSFSHDIFFEWSYFRLLIGLREDWITALVKAGQPPLLGRVVGLLAQVAMKSGGRWEVGLTQLDIPTLRPQWRRAWVTGPTASPEFHRDSARFTAAMEANDWRLMRSFLVWFQAEQTIPNPLIVENIQLPLDGAMRVRLAHEAGWPSDMLTWTRVIIWLISLRDRLPVALLPLVLEVFKIWQNQFTATRNPISEAILAVCAHWIEEIDELTYLERRSFERGRWNALRSEALNSFEADIRQMILTAMRAYPGPGNAVLDRTTGNKQLRSSAYERIMAVAPTIAAVSPEKLAELARAELLKTLPKDEIAEEEERERLSREHLTRIRAKAAADRTRAEKAALSSISMSGFRPRREYSRRELAIEEHHVAYFPTSPAHEPFASLFRESPESARRLIRDMGNHATTAWRQMHELGLRRRGTPTPLDLEFPWGTQRFWGDGDTYHWITDHPAPQPLACAFMSLAHWAHKELDRGVPADEVIRHVVEGHGSLAALALAVTLALEAGHVSATTLPIASAQRLWEMDIARVAQGQMQGIDPLGLGELTRLTGDKENAMEYLKSRQSRRLDIRSLAPLFALSGDEELRRAYRERLARFPDVLPFEYEEERSNSSQEAVLREAAEQWAGLGDASNYRASPTPDGERVMLEYEPSLPLSEERRKSIDESQVSLTEFSFAGWARKSLEVGRPDPSSSLEAALGFIKERDTPTLFDRLTPAGHGMTQSAVSGVAACVLLLSTPTPEDEAWAWDVMRRVERMREDRDDFGGGNMPWHPAFHLIAVLRDNIQKSTARKDAATRLFQLCLHPSDNVARAALATVLKAPDIATAWNATVLGSDLWHRHEPIISRNGDRDHSAQREAEGAAVSRAVERLENETMAVPKPLPAPWTPRPRHGGLLFDYYDGEGERESSVYFDYSAAEKVILALPVDAFCQSEVYRGALWAYVRELVDWTAARFRPEDEMSDAGGRGRRERALLNHWPARLGDLLSRIAPYVEIQEMRTTYLSPFLEPDDVNGMEVTSHFAESMVCRQILDAMEIRPNSIALLQLCVDYVVTDPTFHRRSHRAGQVHGFDLPRMIKSLLFVPLDEPAHGAKRFANGNWSDLPTVLPVVDRIVGECGWAPRVMDCFLTMAERAGLSYPIDAFIALMTRVLTELGGNADGWVGTTIASRIAGVIQTLADGNYPLSGAQVTALLRLLDILIDLGDRRAAALEESETFRRAQTQ